MEDRLILEKSFQIHLKINGEICNRLNRGTKVRVLQSKGNWYKVSWRNGKKKGWICASNL